MVNTCKDCKWWRSTISGYCDNPKLDDTLGGTPGHLDGSWNHGIHQLMSERTQYGPDFGCIHHEPKEKE